MSVAGVVVKDDFAEVCRRVAAARKSNAELLDLSDLLLPRLPEELARCVSLRVLSLGIYHASLQDDKLTWKWDTNRPIQTELSDVSVLAGLTQLQSLSLSVCESLSDVSGLAGLKQLQTLDLSRCKSLSDVSGLAGLTKLQTLNLSVCESLSNVSVLAGLTQLQTLNLSNCQSLSDVSGLAGLTQLQSLNLSDCQSLSDVSGLAGLTQLQSLNLSDCQGLSDVSGLAGLTQLQSLNLSDCQSLSDVSGLTGLTQLQTLGLKLCRNLRNVSGLAGLTQLQTLDLSGCSDLSDVSVLTGLTQLQTLGLRLCRKLRNVSVLAGLTQLQTLDLSGCSGLSNVSALSELTQLRSLGLSYCNSLSDVSGLAGLTELQTLALNDCKSLKCFAPLVPLLDRLETLSLYGCRFDDFHAEVCGEYFGENIVESARAHYRDRTLGETRDAELKVCVLGNGGVGKTQMCRRLNGLSFDPSVPTTHGVQLGHLDLSNNEEPVRLNLWDFGGQDIYHGSHALFVQGQAVFVLLWTPDRESGQFTDGGATMQHRPLSYWLDFVRGLAGSDSTVLIVQSQCDEPSQRQNPDLPTHDFRLLRTLSMSAKTDVGLTVLRGELEDAMRDVLNRKPPIPIGAGRVEVRNQLREMLKEDQQRPRDERQHQTLSLPKFRELCEANGKISSPEALLKYLHRTGVLFYRHGLFGNEIILDQNWALEAIYTLFDRQRTLPVLNRHGRFTRRELELLVWQKFSVAEQELFLSMMESCGICFRVRDVSNDRQQPEWEYLAPELLPEWSVAQDWLLGRMRGDGDETRIEIRYRFLHEGILRGFLSRLGKQAGDAALYWKYGCWFFEKTTDSQALIRSEVDPKSGNGTVTLRAVGGRPKELLETVLKELLSLPIGQPPEVLRSWEKLPNAELLGKVRPRKPRRRKTATDVGDALMYSSEQAKNEGLQSLDVSGRPDLPASSKPAIYVSYAWGDDKSDAGRQREAVVVGLCGMMDRDGYEVLKDDRTLRPGDWISTFMKAIGRGDRVLIIFSKKYLLSQYCMTELFYIYSRSLGEKEDFLKRLIPVNIGDTGRFDDWQTVKEYADHWESVYTKMEPDLKNFGTPQFDLFKRIKRWHAEIGDMLGFIADELHPHDFEAIVKDDFAAVRVMLNRIADKP